MTARLGRHAAVRSLPRRPFAAVGGAVLLATMLAVTLPANAAPAGPGQPAGPGRSGDPAALPERFTAQRLDWQDCGDDIPVEIRCATIDAPIDYLQPDAGTLKVIFSRLAAGKPEKRHGVLFLNPGGPGGPGVDEPRWKRESLSKEIVEQYDLIGFDPRGVGRSTPLSCGLTGDEAVQSVPYRPKNFAHDVEVARSVAAKCAAAGPTVGHVSTRNTARDMDLIRILLGEEKISYFGVSYGTYLGAVYTQLFPQRTDRIVLDSNIDPTVVWRGVFEEMMAFATDDFERFTRWAAERDAEHHLGSTPGAVSDTFWELVARAERNPIDIDGVAFAGMEARAAMAGRTRDPESGVKFMLDLRDALDGKPHALVTPRGGTPNDALTSLYWSVLCNDVSTWSRDPQAYVDDVARNLKRFPLVGDMLSNIVPCAFWSLPRTEPDLAVGNKVPALVVHNEWDAITPGAMGHGMHRAMRGSRLVMVERGTSHGVYDGGNPCVVKAVDSYLITGVLPAENITCTATSESESARRVASAAPHPVHLPLP